MSDASEATAQFAETEVETLRQPQEPAAVDKAAAADSTSDSTLPNTAPTSVSNTPQKQGHVDHGTNRGDDVSQQVREDVVGEGSGAQLRAVGKRSSRPLLKASLGGWFKS